MTLETLQWFFNLKTSAPVSLDSLAILINYSSFNPGVESTFIAIINSNFFLKISFNEIRTRRTNVTQSQE